MPRFSMVSIAILCFACGPVSSQTSMPTDDFRISVGAYGDFQWNIHASDFKELPGMQMCCPGFKKGKGVGGAAGLLIGVPLIPSLKLDVRAGISSYGARFVTSEFHFNIQVDSTQQPVVSEYEIRTKLVSIGVEALADYGIWKGLRCIAGPRAAYVIAKTFDQIETLISPEDHVVFWDTGTRERNRKSGDIPQASSFHLSIEAGLKYELFIDSGNSFVVSPEILFSLGLTPPIPGYKWTTMAVRSGVAVAYRF
jgi:hypothetical protein